MVILHIVLLVLLLISTVATIAILFSIEDQSKRLTATRRYIDYRLTRLDAAVERKEKND